MVVMMPASSVVQWVIYTGLSPIPNTSVKWAWNETRPVLYTQVSIHLYTFLGSGAFYLLIRPHEYLCKYPAPLFHKWKYGIKLWCSVYLLFVENFSPSVIHKDVVWCGMVWHGIVVWRDMVFFSSESEEKMGCCDVCGDLMDSLKKCANCKKVFITFTRNSVITDSLLSSPSFPSPPPPPPPPSLPPSFPPLLSPFLPPSSPGHRHSTAVWSVRSWAGQWVIIANCARSGPVRERDRTQQEK